MYKIAVCIEEMVVERLQLKDCGASFSTVVTEGNDFDMWVPVGVYDRHGCQ